MDNLLHVGLSNALAAAVLALLAAGATVCLRRRPALVHGLWLLVVFKLLTPPANERCFIRLKSRDTRLAHKFRV